MPAFDVVSKVDAHELGNAVDQAKRELERRYDLRGTGARFELEEFAISESAPNEFQLNQLTEILRLRLAARGIDQTLAKKLIAKLKDSKLKIEAQISGDKLRVSGKKRDDLQAAIALLRKAELELPLQFENFRD